MRNVKLEDDQWLKIQEYLRTIPKLKIGSSRKTRRFIEAVRNGDCCPKPMAVGIVSISVLLAGAKQGFGKRCLSTLPMTPIWKIYWLTALSFALIPAPLAHQKTGEVIDQALGRSRGGFSTKIHITVDGLGNPLRLCLTAGERHDSTKALEMLDGFTCQYVIADRAYAGQEIISFILDAGAVPVIPPHQLSKVQREFDRWLYRERHLVECFINKIKHFPRIFSRFDKLARRYLTFLHFVSMLIWLR